MKDFFLKLISAIHNFIFRISGGRWGGRFVGADVLLLTVTGRKSGLPRTVPLLYMRDGEDFIIVASKGGDPKHPTWWLNLEASPDATVEIGSRKLRVTATRVSADEKAALWPRLVAMYRGYGDYQRNTDRDIPVVRLRVQ